MDKYIDKIYFCFLQFVNFFYKRVLTKNISLTMHTYRPVDLFVYPHKF